MLVTKLRFEQIITVTCDVHQDLALGALLFIYRNDLPGSLRCITCLLSADNTTKYVCDNL